LLGRKSRFAEVVGDQVGDVAVVFDDERARRHEDHSTGVRLRMTPFEVSTTAGAVGILITRGKKATAKMAPDLVPPRSLHVPQQTLEEAVMRTLAGALLGMIAIGVLLIAYGVF